jgi:hypothetical protein
MQQQWLATTAFRDTVWYPMMFLLSDGRLVSAGSSYYAQSLAAPYRSDLLSITLSSWELGAPYPYHGASSVMYGPDKILKTGRGEYGGPDAALARRVYAYIPGSDPKWDHVATLTTGRGDVNLVALPDGNVLVVGGNSTDCGPSEHCMTPELINTTSWHVEHLATAPTGSHPRMYHSIALLVPDGRVLIAGGEETHDGPYYRSAQFFRPPYLITATGGPAPRPEIDIAGAPDKVHYGSAFGLPLLSGDGAEISRVSLMALGACTHSFDMNQRRVQLSFLVSSPDELKVSAPAHSFLAPPGHYMLFVLKPGDRAGIEYPSVAKIVKLSAP